MKKRLPLVFNQPDERTQSFASLRRSIKENPFLCISFGLYWMQTTLLFQSPYLFLEAAPFANIPLPKGTVLLVASVVTYLIWSSLFRRINGVSMKPLYPYVLCLALLVGALLFTCYPLLSQNNPGLAIVFYLLGSICIGSGTAHINLEASRIFGYLGPKQTLFHLVCALLIGTAGAYLFSLLPLEAGKIAIVAVPIPMVFCLMKGLRVAPRKTLYSQGLDTQVKLPTKFLVTSAFQGLALGAMHGLLLNTYANSALLVSLGFLAAICLMFFCSISLKSDFDFLFYRIGFPLMATGFFLLGIAPALVPPIGAAVLDTGYCFQYLISCSLCSYLAKGLKQPPVWIVGTSTACLLAGQFIGTLTELLIPDQALLAVSLTFVLLLAALYMTSSKNLQRGWGAISPGNDPKDVSGNEALVVQLLASEHGLSERETQVFALLIKGYNRKAIGSELFLAEETIKTHTGHIYHKFLVHSKQELITLAHKRAALMSK